MLSEAVAKSEERRVSRCFLLMVYELPKTVLESLHSFRSRDRDGLPNRVL